MAGSQHLDETWSQSDVCLFLSVRTCPRPAPPPPPFPLLPPPPKALPFQIVVILCCFISLGTMCVNIYYKWRRSILFWRCRHLHVQPVDLNSASSVIPQRQSVRVPKLCVWLCVCLSCSPKASVRLRPCPLRIKCPHPHPLLKSRLSAGFVSDARRHGWVWPNLQPLIKRKSHHLFILTACG